MPLRDGPWRGTAMIDRRDETAEPGERKQFTRRGFLRQTARLGAGAAVLTSAGELGGLLGSVGLAEGQAPKRGGTPRFRLADEALPPRGAIAGGGPRLGVVMGAVYRPPCAPDY